MPKLIVNSTGDQFFLPDSAQFYVHDLPGENRLRYMPNTDHGIEQGSSLEELGASLISFFTYVANDYPLPSFTWEVTRDNEIQVRTESTSVPISVRLWSATVSGPMRDFRYASVGAVWSSQVLDDPDGDGIYLASVPTPTAADTWTGFFVDLTFMDRGLLRPIAPNCALRPTRCRSGRPSCELTKTRANDGELVEQRL